MKQNASQAARTRSDDFLKISGEFKLGALVTESSHPVTAALSEVAQKDISAALGLLFQVDRDVVARFGEFVKSGRAQEIQQAVLLALRSGGRIFFTGCGSTGRLSIQLVSIWRDFWQKQRACGLRCSPPPGDWERRAMSVMAGGDFALIKSVEGFEDFAAFGRKQLADLGVASHDVVFAITEGGETPFVIGTAWQALEAGAKVYFVYNNPDDLLCRYVARSREVIQEARIQKINLTTGPMAITGSTRMQATSIQLCVLTCVLEMVVQDLLGELCPGRATPDVSTVPEEFLRKLRKMHETLESAAVREDLAKLVELEEGVYRSGHKNNYYADAFAIDVLTDTTERSPTYCTPPFRKFDDSSAAESWAFLFVPSPDTPTAWERILKRKPLCLSWSAAETAEIVGRENAERVSETLRRIGLSELMRFKIGLDGRDARKCADGDSAIAVLSDREITGGLSRPFFLRELSACGRDGASVGAIVLEYDQSLDERTGAGNLLRQETGGNVMLARVALPEPVFLLDGVTRVGLKMVLNALSTCTMVRLGRVMGNHMIFVVASNLKLIDRATRYIERLTGRAYEDSNRLLFEVLHYVEPRMKADQPYPPVVALAVLRARHDLTNECAEQMLSRNF